MSAAATPHLWERQRHRPRGAASCPAHEDDRSDSLRQAFRLMLERLCGATGVPPSDRATVIRQAALTLSGTHVAFELEPWSGFVKLYIDVGRPAPTAAHDLYRMLLEQMLHLPAPFSMVPALHADSGRIVLHACAPLPADEEADARLLGFLAACMSAARELRAGNGIEAMDLTSGRAG